MVKPHPLTVSNEPLQLSDPHMKPKVKRGTVQIEVLKNMTYLEGQFYNVGARVTVGQDEAHNAIRIGAAKATEFVPVEAQ